jgi:hypothetical protein
MKADIASLTRAYAPKGILVDSNLFLLFLIGTMNRDMIQRFKRTETFLPEDYDVLVDYLDLFSTRVTTPNVLTEVSNLANVLTERSKNAFWCVLKSAVDILDETYISSKSLVGRTECAKFGITDTAITAVVKGQFLLLTDDFRLSQYFQSTGGDVVNFNHLRMLNWRRL